MRVLAIFCAAFAAGVALSQYLLSAQWALILCGVFAAAALVMGLCGCANKRGDWAKRAFLCALGLGFAFGYNTLYAHFIKAPNDALLGTQDTVKVELLGYAEETSHGAKVTVKILNRGLPGRAIYYGDADLMDLAPGAHVTAEALFNSATDPTGKGLQLRNFTAKGVYVLLYQRGDPTYDDTNAGALKYLPQRIARTLGETIERSYSEREGAFLRALLLGDKKYLDEAKFFLDYRGKTSIKQEYSQSHKPVLEQDEAVGHAVRATYMYAGMADVAALTGDTAYIHAIDRIWDNIVSKKLYITGGIGATNNGEAFGKNYELPNMSAYCETCAAIGNVYVNYRLFLLHGESKYYDVLERTLYNGLISGVSMDGGGFFYPNPLESMGQHQRQAWFGCACCPSNICRFLPSLPGYVYAVKDKNVYVNLFLSNSSSLKVAGKKVSLSQDTQYPWNGNIAIKVDDNKAGQFGMKIRIPGWVKGQPVPSDLYYYSDGKRLGYTITVNGKKVEAKVTEDGYYTINRKWKKGDVVRVHFDMEARTVRANNKVEADRGCISIERGPIVYCAEWPDNKGFDIMSILENREPQFADGKLSYDGFIDPKYKNVLTLYKGQNMETLTENVQTLAYDKSGKLSTKDQTLTLIPYFAWAHRGNGNMKVWLPQDVKAAKPSAPATLAAQAKVEFSSPVPAKSSITDGLVPADENDRSIPYIHWWPKKNTTEWITYTFPETKEIKTSTVYWYDDQPWGGCKVPDSWKLYYQDEAGNWKEVPGADAYPCKRGVACIVNFDPVKTKAVKLELKQPETLSCGLFEWSVK